MLIHAKYRSGFSLIELVITLTIAALLLFLAESSFSGWIGNAKARSVAESLQNGLRLAQAEAVRRNRQVAFVLTNSSPAVNVAANANGNNWYAQVLPIYSTEVVSVPYVQGGSFASIASGVTVVGSALICFNSLGRVVVNSSASVTAAFGASCAATNAVYSITAPGANRTYQVQVNMGGQVRMCDASRALSPTAPDGC